MVEGAELENVLFEGRRKKIDVRLRDDGERPIEMGDGGTYALRTSKPAVRVRYHFLALDQF